jgi:hypothetical protein
LACPFENKPVPLRQLDVEANRDEPGQPKDSVANGRDIESRFKTFEQIIRHAIANRTRGRIRSLEVSVSDERIIIRGRAPSFYLKQLALRGVLDVMDLSNTVGVNLAVEVEAPGTSHLESGVRCSQELAMSTSNQ